jgi:hypothetical protein
VFLLTLSRNSHDSGNEGEGGVSPSPEVEGGGVEVDGGDVLRGSGVEVDGLRKRIVVARSEGGGIEADGLRKRMVAARSEAEVEAVACSGAGDEALGPGSRTAGGGGVMISRAITERERVWEQKFAKCGERERVA